MDNKNNRYKLYKEEIQSKYDSMPLIFIIGNDQYQDFLKNNNITEQEFQNNYLDFFGGSIIKKTDKDICLKALDEAKKLKDELADKLVKDDDLLKDALIYEMYNHEFILDYYDGYDDIIESIGLSPDDFKNDQKKEILNKAFNEYKHSIFDEDYDTDSSSGKSNDDYEI